MTYRLKYLLVLLSVLMFGCDEELNVLEGPDAQNWAFHGTRDSLNSVALEVSVNNIDSIALKSIAVAVVDDSLNVLRTRTVKKGSLKNDSIYVPADDYESPYVRLTYVGVMPNRDSISLVFYFDINESKSYRVNVVDAFMQYRIEDLVAQENYPLRIAKKIALSDLQDFLSDELELFPDKSVFYSEEWILYSCGYFSNDDSFAKKFDELAKAFASSAAGKKVDYRLDSVMVADNMVQNSCYFNYCKSIVQRAYEYPKCDKETEGDTVYNEVESSLYVSRSFYCQSGNYVLIPERSSSSSVVESSSSAKSSSSVSSSSSKCVEDSVVVEGEEYSSCRNGVWKRMSWDEIVAYHGKAYEQKYGTCETDPWEKPLVYMEEIEGFMGCVQKKDEYVPDEIKVDCCHSIDSIQDGHFVGDAVYEISDYGFKWIFKLGALSESELTVRSIVVDGKKYKPTFSKQNDNFLIFITPQDTTISYNTLVDSLFDLSEKDWEMVEVVENNYTRYYSGDHPLVTWDEAKSNCPPGFEIPDTLTFRYHYKNKESVSVWPEGRFMNFSREYVVYFWTSQKVSENTMLCARVMDKSDNYSQTIDFVECPVDASVVQAGYVTKVKAK